MQCDTVSANDTPKGSATATALARAILSIEPQHREEVLEGVLGMMRAGPPVPPFTTAMAEASHWADWASPAELKAYALACFKRLPPSDQQGFLGYVQKEAA